MLILSPKKAIRPPHSSNAPRRGGGGGGGGHVSGQARERRMETGVMEGWERCRGDKKAAKDGS